VEVRLTLAGDTFLRIRHTLRLYLHVLGPGYGCQDVHKFGQLSDNFRVICQLWCVCVCVCVCVDFWQVRYGGVRAGVQSSRSPTTSFTPRRKCVPQGLTCIPLHFFVALGVQGTCGGGSKSLFCACALLAWTQRKKNPFCAYQRAASQSLVPSWSMCPSLVSPGHRHVLTCFHVAK
jgi:hypothetical protein